jgi:hypothetical protein
MPRKPGQRDFPPLPLDWSEFAALARKQFWIYRQIARFYEALGGLAKRGAATRNVLRRLATQHALLQGAIGRFPKGEIKNWSKHLKEAYEETTGLAQVRRGKVYYDPQFLDGAKVLHAPGGVAFPEK